MLWNTSYETGVPAMDAEHQQLFRQIDTLLDLSKTDQVKMTLDFLAKYVVQHFASEEDLQTKSRYPGYAGHKRKHVAFVDSYKTLRQEYNSDGDNPLLLMKITCTALDWLKEHIRSDDKEFATYYKAASQPAERPRSYSVAATRPTETLSKPLGQFTGKIATPSRSEPAERSFPPPEPLGPYVKTPYSSNTAKIRAIAAETRRQTSMTRAFLRRETDKLSKTV